VWNIHQRRRWTLGFRLELDGGPEGVSGQVFGVANLDMVEDDMENGESPQIASHDPRGDDQASPVPNVLTTASEYEHGITDESSGFKPLSHKFPWLGTG